VSELPKSAAAAREVGAKFYFTGKPCKRGHVAERYLTGACVTCQRASATARYAVCDSAEREARNRRNRAYNEREAEKVRASKQAYYEKNSEVICQRTGAYKKREAEKVSFRNQTYREENLEAIRLHDRQRKHEQPEKCRYWGARRRAALSARRPRWLSDEHEQQIQALYAEAQRLSQVTGEIYHVDHIIPLRGKAVSGLHVPGNMQVLLGAENLRKNNKFEGLES
jgi:hypothetical protein